MNDVEKRKILPILCPLILLQISESDSSEFLRTHNNLLSIYFRCLKVFFFPCSTNSQKLLIQDDKDKHIIPVNNVVNPRIRPDYIWYIAHTLPRTKVLSGLKTKKWQISRLCQAVRQIHFMSRYYLSRVSHHGDNNSKQVRAQGNL